MAQQTSVTSLPPDARVAWVAARQHGVISLEQLARVGVTRFGVQRRVSAGWLHRRHRGVFAVGHPALTDRGRWAAAVLAGGAEAVLSHRSAGALWGLMAEVPMLDITVPGRHRAAQPGVILHANRLDPQHVTRIDGLPTTSLPRTLLDLAEVLSVDALVRCIDRTGNQLRPDHLSSMINEHHGRHGLRPLKEALLRTRPQDILTRSELERRALALIEDANLDHPEVNVRLHGYEVDLLWRDHRLVVELDGRRWHDTPFSRDRDYRRDTNLLCRGYRVMRLTWRQVVNDPVWVTRRLRQALRPSTARRWSG
jgi:very-short-patch-repair endonuclease